MSAGDGPPSSRSVPSSFRVFEFLFLISLFIFPFFFGAVDLWSFSAGAAVLCGAFSIHWFKQGLREPGFLRSGLDGWIMVYVCFFLLSLRFSKLPYFSWVELFKLGVVLCAYLATRYLCRERLQIYRLSESFVLLGGLLSAIGLLQFVGGLPHYWWSKASFLSSMYVNHNHFAGLLVLILPIALGLVLAERDRSKKILLIFLTTLMGTAFVFALSRGACVALGVSLVWMMWALKRRHLVSSAVLPFLLFVVLIVGVVVIFGTESIEQRLANIQAMNEQEELSLRYRWLTWLGTIPMISRFLWFGSGPGTFGHLFLQFRPEGFSMRPVYAHNDFLHLLAECGIFSFLASAGLVTAFFRMGWDVIRRDESRLRIGVGSGVMAGILGLLVHALFDFNFHIPANWLLSAVAAGLLFSMDEDRFYDSRRLSRALKALVPLLLAALFAGSFYLGVSNYRFWEAKNLVKAGERKGAFEAVEKSLRLNPLDAEAYYLRGFIRLSDARTGGKEPSDETVRAVVKDLDEAIRLNPYEPAYDLVKAQALAPRLAKESPSELVTLFEKTIAKDPNNEKLAFLVAREAFEGGRAVKVPLLRKAAGRLLEARRESLAGLVNFLETQDFWRYHREYHLKLLGVDPDKEKRSSPSDLWDRTPSAQFDLNDFSNTGSEPVSKDEIFFRNGEISIKLEIHNPLVRIVLESKGSDSNNIYPVLYVKIDGKVADEYYVDSKTYKNYYTDLKLKPGPHLLSLEYVNDLKTGGLAGGDRNVWIRRVSLLEA